jgi:hypothetical protein
MDTTPEYIKQCAMAAVDLYDYYLENHSSLRPLFIYDFATERVSMLMWAPNVLREKLGIKENSIIVSIESDKDRGMWIQEGTRESDKPVIILWRQDQLLDLLWPGFNKMERGDPVYLIWELADETKGEKRMQNRWRKFLSLEQLYLAMVMQRMHKKRWNGEEWVKI